MKTKVWKGLALMVTLSVFTVGFFVHSAMAKVTTVILWNAGGNPFGITWQEKRVEEFNKTHPDIQIEFQKLEWPTHQEQMLTAFLAKRGPDVFLFHFTMIPKLAGMGVLADLDEIKGFEAVRNQFSKPALTWGQFGGKQLGITYLMNPFIMISHKDLFEDAGLEPPKTQTEMRDLARKLTKDIDGDGKPDQWGMGQKLAQIGGGFVVGWAPFLLAAGGAFLNDEMTEAVINGPAGVAATQLFVDMVNVDKSAPPSAWGDKNADIMNQFMLGKVAMQIQGPWYVSVFEQWKPGFALGPESKVIVTKVPVTDPALGPYVQGTLFDAVSAGISTTAKDKEAALKVLEFLIGVEAQWTWLDPKLNMPVSAPEVLYSPKASERIPFLSLYGEMMLTARPWPFHGKVFEIMRIVERSVLLAIKLETSAKEAMDTAAKEIQDIL